ncbi:ABC exporter membrane fusion protein [Pseudanabaena sp. FACHB-2040]|uniref:ABC exporter membrane fusion protein n=1 Tax=Pseudanabaena sp. FACHB-2040 TaxID=2692859 RepID=UPI0016839C4C|nr:ABC exporter membrane fusion protein [Pseudanabaena sp. FACHB-2040]MBD2256622.1 ABC exporter membrane fusion protein [Pseudanabaena sp. FACHB-2040]
MTLNSVSGDKPLLKPTGRWITIAAIAAALTLSGVTLRYFLQLQHRPQTASMLETSAPAQAVSALGYLKPAGEVIYLSAPTNPTGLSSSRVARLLVSEGDRIEANQIVAVLDNLESLQAALNQAVKEVELARANLAKVKAGAKAGELEAQGTTITQLQADLRGQLAAQDQAVARLAAELENAQLEHQRYHELFAAGAVTASQLDNKRLVLETTEKQLNEAAANRDRISETFQQRIRVAQATLSQLAEVRPTDVQVAQAEIDRAMADVTKAEADLKLAYVYAPIDGQILKVHTQVGELISDKGIVALGQTEQMTVITEVYELDIHRVEVGQKATITSHAIPTPLHGTVTQVGLQVNPQALLSTNPAADIDRRIVEVEIRLDAADSQRASRLTNLQVDVVIDI